MQYEDRIVCFIDILGFKQHIKESNDDVNKVENIAEALLAVRRILDIDDPEEQGLLGTKITQFSDSIVISFKYNQKSEVYFTLLKLIWVQGSLINKGMLVRGAIVRGDFIHTGEVLFGQGLVDAYEAETKAAIYPRIILGSDVLHVALNHSKHHPVEEAEYLGEILKIDIDGFYYIDYFGDALRLELDDPDFEYLDYLRKIKDIVVKNIDVADVGLKAKYNWVLKKYNENIDNMSGWLKQQGIEPLTLKIKAP